MWISGSCAAPDSNKSSHGRSRPEQESLSRCKCKKSHVLTSRPSPLISTSGFYIPSSLLSQHFARYIVRVCIIKASCHPRPLQHHYGEDDATKFQSIWKLWTSPPCLDCTLVIASSCSDSAVAFLNYIIIYYSQFCKIALYIVASSQD